MAWIYNKLEVARGDRMGVLTANSSRERSTSLFIVLVNNFINYFLSVDNQ